MPPITRRTFTRNLALAGLSTSLLFHRTWADKPSQKGRRLLFRSRGEVPEKGTLGIVNADGSGLRPLKLEVPDQVSWGVGPTFADGNRVILMSVEGTKTWEGTVLSRTWIYRLDTDTIEEIARSDPEAPYMPPIALLPGEERMLVGPVIDGEQRVWSMNLDGSDPREITHEGEGFSYGVSLSPDATRVAFHATGVRSYEIVVCNLDGSDRKIVASDPAHLYFGPVWSPDGEWLLYLDCHHVTDPGHDWADLCIGRPDGSEHRKVTEGQRHWFGTSYGGPKTRGSGSNMPRWSPNRNVCTYTRALPDSRTAWDYQTDRPDTDHFNREYDAERARGGTEILLLDPFTGETETLTHRDPDAKGRDCVWDFRTAWSPDGHRIAFCRSRTGEPSELWVMDTDGGNAKALAQGFEGLGVDHPVWI
ncbi:MAG: PD40 domain-containing protein [Candidatus Omnitrophica bacterium]|nr:PD40 domain-containing protein [Candidatus Omnitrophota bacterium]